MLDMWLFGNPSKTSLLLYLWQPRAQRLECKSESCEAWCNCRCINGRCKPPACGDCKIVYHKLLTSVRSRLLAIKRWCRKPRRHLRGKEVNRPTGRHCTAKENFMRQRYDAAAELAVQ